MQSSVLWCALWLSVFFKKRYGLQRLQVPASSASSWSDKQVLRSDVCFVSGRACCLMSHTSAFEIRVAADCSSQHKVGAALARSWFFFFYFFSSALHFWELILSYRAMEQDSGTEHGCPSVWICFWFLGSPRCFLFFLCDGCPHTLLRSGQNFSKWLIASSKGVFARDSSPFLLAKETWLIQARFG